MREESVGCPGPHCPGCWSAQKQTGSAMTSTDPAPASLTGYPPPPIERIESSVTRDLRAENEQLRAERDRARKALAEEGVLHRQRLQAYYDECKRAAALQDALGSCVYLMEMGFEREDLREYGLIDAAYEALSGKSAPEPTR